MNFTFDHARAVAEHVNEVRFFDVLAALNHAATENGASFGPDKDAGAECDNDTMLALAAALAWAWHGWRGFNPSTLALDDAGDDVLDAAAEQWPGIDHIDLPDA